MTIHLFIFSFLFSILPFIPAENSCTLIHSFIHEHIHFLQNILKDFFSLVLIQANG